MPTLLGYSIIPNPQPLQASPATGSPLIAQLTLVATNNSQNAVTINWLKLSIPVGTVASDLTNATTGFGTNLPASWQLGSPSQSSGLYTFVFTAPNGGATVPAGQDIIFTISNIPLVTQPGSPVLTITEGSNGSPTQNVSLTLYPNGFGTISFIASPANINSGGNVKLSWIGPSAATYELQYEYNGAIITVPGNGNPPLASTGSYPGQGAPPLVLNQTTVFTLTVTQVLNSVPFILASQQTVSVVVAPPSIGNFNVSPETLTQADVTNPVTASWTGSNIAQMEVANNVYTGVDPNNGSMQITVNNSSWIQATASGFPGASPASVNLSPPYFVPCYYPYTWTGTVAASGSSETISIPNNSSAAIQLNVSINVSFTNIIDITINITLSISAIVGNYYSVLGNSPPSSQADFVKLANQPKTPGFSNTNIWVGSINTSGGSVEVNGNSLNNGASWFVLLPDGSQMVVTSVNSKVDNAGNITCSFEYFDFPGMPGSVTGQ